jgi:hypothetical protein
VLDRVRNSFRHGAFLAHKNTDRWQARDRRAILTMYFLLYHLAREAVKKVDVKIQDWTQ